MEESKAPLLNLPCFARKEAKPSTLLPPHSSLFTARKKACAAKEFFRWTHANGKQQATALGYVPLPPALVQQIEAYWTKHMAF